MPDGDLQKELDALRSDIANIRADLSRITEAIGTSAGESLRSRFDELQRRLRDQFDQIFDTARSQGKRSVEGVEHQVEERPFMSLVVAFGVGLLLSQLLMRR